MENRGYKQKWALSSPNARIDLVITLNENGELLFHASKESSAILDESPLGIKTADVDFSRGLIFRNAISNTIEEEYELPHGKTRLYSNKANELILIFEKEGYILQVTFRVYLDGFVFRYEIPKDGEIQVLSETTKFVFPNQPLINIWAAKWMECYERTYDLHMFEHLDDESFGMPMLYQLGSSNWALLTEAGVYGNYCACHVRGDTNMQRSLAITFAPDQEGPIRGTDLISTPWRTFIVGDDLSDIVESTLVFDVNPSSEIEDLSWIKPGRSAWSWYSDGQSCGNMEIQKKYVDFAAEMGWEYSLVDGGWEESDLDVPKLVHYANEAQVGIWLWSHYRNIKEREICEEKFKLWAGWGVKGVKVDFFDSDAQEVIKVYDMIAETAARHQLMINYHGSTKPSGEQRRWPHVLTREGIYGAEYWRNISEGPNAVHNCTVPFTRNVIGSMDYTPVTFSRPTRTSTCHQLALSVVFESAVQNFADSAEAYLESVAKPFLKAVPAVWEETRLLEGYPGRFVTMARKSGDDWFIGAICAAAGRTAEMKLDFLDADCVYEAEIYEDTFGEADHYRFRAPTEVKIRHITVTSQSTIRSDMKVYGGTAIRLTKKR